MLESNRRKTKGTKSVTSGKGIIHRIEVRNQIGKEQETQRELLQKHSTFLHRLESSIRVRATKLVQTIAVLGKKEVERRVSGYSISKI